MHDSTRKRGLIAKTLLMSAIAAIMVAVMACGGEKIVEVEKIVTQEVIKEVQVAGETIVVEKEVVKEVEVAGETVIVEKEVVKTVEVEKPVEVVREVVRTVEVEKEVVVEKEVKVEVEVIKEVEVEKAVEVTFPVPNSVLRIAARDVGQPGWFTPISVVGRSWAHDLQILEHLGTYQHDATLAPELAREWTIDGTGITWEISHGAKWQDPQYGTVDAHDVHFSLTEGSREGTQSHFVGWYAEDFQNQHVVDEDTLRWDWGEGGPTMRYIMSIRDNCCGSGIYSKKYYDAVGEEAFNLDTMGSGQYKLTQHVADDVIETEAIPDHWIQNGEWAKVRAFEVPEQSTRIALVRANQADVTDIAIGLIDQVIDDPTLRLFTGSQADPAAMQLLPGGNWQIQPYWQNLDVEAEAPAYVENPWVGIPGDEVDLERAVNIRRAMSFAIDRDTINEEILLGQGCAQYVYLIDECSPFFKPEWKHEYSVEKAKEYMALGGFPDGFKAKIWIPSESPGATFQEIGEAILPMLNAIGIETEVDKSSWAARKQEMYREEPLLRDIMMFPWGGNLPLLNFTDYLADLIEGETLWNSGYDHPIGYEIYDNFKAAYADPLAAWAALDQYWAHHSWLEDMSVISVVDWTDPILVGPMVGEVDLIWNVAQSMKGYHVKID